MKSKLSSVVVATVVLGLLVASCGPAATPVPTPTATPKPPAATPTAVPPTPTPAPRFKGEATVGIVEDFQTLDPHQHTIITAYMVHDHIYGRLVELDAEGNFVPALAESWSTPDANTWVFKLRQGVRFHNGEEFTSESVKVSLMRYLEDFAEPYSRTDWSDLETVETPDKYTAVVRTKKPVAIMLNLLALAHMLPPEGIKDPAFFDKPAGTGAFKVVEYIKGDRIVLEANEDYWREGMPKLAKVTFRVMLEDMTRISALKAGEVDIVEEVPPEQVEDLKAAPGIDVVIIPIAMIRYVALNNEREPFNNVLVRQAVNYAIDRQAIIDKLFLGYADTPAGQVPPGSLHRNTELSPFPYDPVKAKQLLTEAGYPDGFEIDLMALGGTSIRTVEELTIMQSNLADVGIKGTINVPEHTAARALRTKGEYDFCLSGSSNMRRHAGPWLWGTYGPGNFRRYENEKFNELVSQANETTDLDKQAELLKEAQRIIWEEAADLVIYYQTGRWGVSERLKGASFSPARTVDLRNAYLEP